MTVLLGSRPVWSAAQAAPHQPSAQAAAPVVELSLQDAFDRALRAQAAHAQRLGQTPVVELDAPWCHQCQHFDTNVATAREGAMVARIALIRINVDEWDDAFLRLKGFEPESTVLAFIPIDAHGRPTGPPLTRRTIGSDDPATLTTALQQLVRERQTPITRPDTARRSTDSRADSAARVPVITLSKQQIFLTAFQEQTRMATSLGRTPFLVSSDPGCQPCLNIQEEIREGTPHAVTTFAHVYLLVLNPEWWPYLFEGQREIQYNRATPTFFAIDRAGTLTDHHIDAPNKDQEWSQFQQFFTKHLWEEGPRS